MPKKASEHFRSYVNTGGPTVSTMSRKITESDGLYFKDIDGSGELSPVNDWRRSPEERAAAYVKLLSLEEKLACCPREADIAILMISPSSGDYFTATAGYLELDICEGKTVPNVDDRCRPMKETRKETTLSGANRIAEIAADVHSRGGKVIANINFPLAWLVGNVERNVDALTAGFDTYSDATLDVIFGAYEPTGKLPITLPRGDEVLHVDENGVCISPNDVPGYDKDLYMPEHMKDGNGKAYAYRDAAGNYYELDFGLRY